MPWVEADPGRYLASVLRDGARPLRYRDRIGELLGRCGSPGAPRPARPMPLVEFPLRRPWWPWEAGPAGIWSPPGAVPSTVTPPPPEGDDASRPPQPARRFLPPVRVPGGDPAATPSPPQRHDASRPEQGGDPSPPLRNDRGSSPDAGITGEESTDTNERTNTDTRQPQTTPPAIHRPPRPSPTAAPTAPPANPRPPQTPQHPKTSRAPSHSNISPPLRNDRGSPPDAGITGDITGDENVDTYERTNTDTRQPQTTPPAMHRPPRPSATAAPTAPSQARTPPTSHPHPNAPASHARHDLAQLTFGVRARSTQPKDGQDGHAAQGESASLTPLPRPTRRDVIAPSPSQSEQRERPTTEAGNEPPVASPRTAASHRGRSRPRPPAPATGPSSTGPSTTGPSAAGPSAAEPPVPTTEPPAPHRRAPAVVQVVSSPRSPAAYWARLHVGRTGLRGPR